MCAEISIAVTFNLFMIWQEQYNSSNIAVYVIKRLYHVTNHAAGLYVHLFLFGSYILIISLV